ncbi:protein MIZU-KUSSEI 1-like [Musa acuminata AAA Group]
MPRLPHRHTLVSHSWILCCIRNIQMRTMIDLGSQRDSLYIIDTATAVDCTKDVRFRRSFRSLIECVVPCCGFQLSSNTSDVPDSHSTGGGSTPPTTTVTGTFYGHRRGHVRFCLHDSSRTSPILLLEFTIPTACLAREMRHGLLRVGLECDRNRARCSSLFGVPVWSVYCNGRKVGFAIRRRMSEGDAAILKLMRAISVGTGVLPGASKMGEGDILYLRASFERVIGSINSESFHMINPVGCTGQQLSIFLVRS